MATINFFSLSTWAPVQCDSATLPRKKWKSIFLALNLGWLVTCSYLENVLEVRFCNMCAKASGGLTDFPLTLLKY